MAQEQTLQSKTKNASSSSSLSLPLCCGKQLIKLKPPLVAQAENIVKKDDGDSSTALSSSVHSGTQALQFLIEDDHLYFNMKQPAITDFTDKKEKQQIAQHICHCNIGGITCDEVTMEVHHPIEQLQVLVTAPTLEKFQSLTMKKKDINDQNIDHEDQFKECMESYSVQKGADSFDTITNAIAFYEKKSTTDSYRQYRCKQHEGCPFQISFGRQRNTGFCWK